jgi:pilus assembly protein CpaB
MGVNTAQDSGALRRAAERGARKTGWRAALFLVIAALGSVGVALLFTRYLDARTAAARVPTTPVVVAGVDLPEATELRPETLNVVAWPRSSLPEGTFSDTAALKDRVLTVRIVKGQPILATNLAGADAGRGLAALLPSGMRAISVRVDDVVGVAGFVHPGDSVDVIVTMRPNDNVGVLPISKVVLQNIRVLAVGKQVERNDREKYIPATVATLMVDSEQSEKLALAASKGQILLALRSGLDREVVETSGVIAPVLLAVRPVPAAPAPAAHTGRQLARAPEPKPEHDTVEILRGDLFERRDFDKGTRK